MKKRLSSFFAGMLTMALIGSLAIPVLASAGMTITVDPINIQVNGQTFAPKDVKGNDVPVFAYNGTTYAPLRALAEAYGLEVGYDSSTNMATVSEPSEPTPTVPSAGYTDIGGINVSLVKIGNKYYSIGAGGYSWSNYYAVDTDSGVLLFADDINIAEGGYCSSWLFNYVVRLALLDKYTITPSENPYIDGNINIDSPSMTLEEVLTCGIGKTEYLSASKSYVPMWAEYDGKRLYRQSSRTNDLTEISGIRYINGYICMNDVLAYWGINKMISVGKHGDTWYIEIR